MDYYNTIIILCACFLAFIITYVYCSLSREYKRKEVTKKVVKRTKKQEVVVVKEKEKKTKKSRSPKVVVVEEKTVKPRKTKVEVKEVKNNNYKAKKNVSKDQPVTSPELYSKFYTKSSSWAPFEKYDEYGKKIIEDDKYTDYEYKEDYYISNYQVDKTDYN